TVVTVGPQPEIAAFGIPYSCTVPSSLVPARPSGPTSTEVNGTEYALAGRSACITPNWLLTFSMTKPTRAPRPSDSCCSRYVVNWFEYGCFRFGSTEMAPASELAVWLPSSPTW